MLEIRDLKVGDEAAVEGFLEQWSESSLLVLSNLRQVGLKPGSGCYHGYYCGAFQDGRLIGVAVHFWNGMLFVRTEDEAGALAVRAVSSSRFPIAGILGPSAQVAEARSALGLEKAEVSFEGSMDIMALDLNEISVPDVLENSLIKARRARSSELDLVANWLTRFSVEVEGIADSPALYGKSYESAQRFRREKRLFVLERGGQIVASCVFSAVYGDIVRVGYVWTPPGLRNSGYASGVVAGALLAARAEGANRACLIANDPAALRSYLGLGFQRIDRETLVHFNEEMTRLTA